MVQDFAVSVILISSIFITVAPVITGCLWKIILSSVCVEIATLLAIVVVEGERAALTDLTLVAWYFSKASTGSDPNSRIFFMHSSFCEILKHLSCILLPLVAMFQKETYISRNGKTNKREIQMQLNF